MEESIAFTVLKGCKIYTKYSMSFIYRHGRYTTRPRGDKSYRIRLSHACLSFTDNGRYTTRPRGDKSYRIRLSHVCLSFTENGRYAAQPRGNKSYIIRLSHVCLSFTDNDRYAARPTLRQILHNTIISCLSFIYRKWEIRRPAKGEQILQNTIISSSF